MGGTLEQVASEVCGPLISQPLASGICGPLISQSHTHCARMDTGFCLQVSDQAI